MRTRLVAAPTTLAVSLDRAKKNLRIAGDRQDDIVEDWLAGVIRHAESYTGRSLMKQEWCATLDSFPAAIKLRHPPILQVSSVRFIDVDGVWQTLAPADYLVDTASEPGFVVPAPGKAFPATQGRINTVEVRYFAGYGETADATPRDIRLYLLAKLREQFDALARPERDTVQASYIDSLLDTYIIY